MENSGLETSHTSSYRSHPSSIDSSHRLDSEQDAILPISPEPRANSIELPLNTDADQDAITPIAPASESTSPPRCRALLLEKEPESSQDEGPLIRYRRRTVWLLIFYVPLLILPWIFTCVLSVRRIDGGPYVVQSGMSPKAQLSLGSWLSATIVLKSINTVATIPAMSALVAQAAIVHCQRRRLDQKFTLRQTIALADRGWSDITILWDARKTGASSRFLWLAFAFISVCAIQQPIQSLFVSYAAVHAVTCADTPVYGCSLLGPTTIGHDPEPIDMANLPQNIVVQAVAAEISSQSEYAIDPYMWVEYPNNNGNITGVSQPFARQTAWYYDEKSLSRSETNFVAPFPNGTNTGVLRQHVMRFNSTVECEKIPSYRFPTECPGARPLTAQFIRPGKLELKVCVPGQYGVHPWSLSRNRQHLSEEIYFNISSGRNTKGSIYSGVNTTLHCTANTTRGYFELGNWQNNFQYGPLKETWPSPEDLKENFNDYRGVGAHFARPRELDVATDGSRLLIWKQTLDRFGTQSHNASGPLMTSAIAIFGNGSFFQTASLSNETTFPNAAVQICSQNSIPYTRLGLLKFDQFQGLCYGSNLDYSTRDASRVDDHLIRIMSGWANSWNDTQAAEQALSMAAFAANKAMLTKTVEASFSFESRPIYTSPGLIVPRPVKSLAGTIVVSILIFLQLCGIAYITWYIYQMPSWSHALDAAAMLRLGAGVQEAGHQLPAIRALQEKDLASLKDIDGVVGAEKIMDEELQANQDESVRLTLGGQGLITKELSRRKDGKGIVKKWKKFWAGPKGLKK